MSADNDAPVRLAVLAPELDTTVDLLEFLEPDGTVFRDHIGFRCITAARAAELIAERDREAAEDAANTTEDRRR
jgi:hypothetical protein